MARSQRRVPVPVLGIGILEAKNIVLTSQGGIKIVGNMNSCRYVAHVIINNVKIL